MGPDTARVDIDLDDPVRPRRRRRPRRSWWVLAGLVVLAVGLPGGTAVPDARPTRPASVRPLPSARVTSGVLTDRDITELPPGANSGASPWCRTNQLHGGHVVLVPCGEAYPG